MAALDLGRSVILNDLHPDYVALCRERLAVWPNDLRGPQDCKHQDIESEELPLFEGVDLD